MAEERILIIKCGGDCRYLRVNQAPFDEDKNLYCTYNPHSEWEQITPLDCATCKRTGRFDGVSVEKAVDTAEAALFELFDNNANANYREIAETVINALLKM